MQRVADSLTESDAGTALSQTQLHLLLTSSELAFLLTIELRGVRFEHAKSPSLANRPADVGNVMRILVWTCRNIVSDGGERTLMYAKQRALEQLGCTVGYVSSPIRRSPGSNGNVLKAMSGWKIFSRHKSYHTLRQLCMKWKPDILVGSGIWISYGWSVLARIRHEYGIPVSFDMQGVLEEVTEYNMVFGSCLASQLVFRASRRAERALLQRCADHVEAVSVNMELYIRKTYPEYLGPVTIVPCGISTVIDDESYQRNRLFWRSRLGLDPARPAAAYSGSTARWQGIGDIVALARARPNMQVYLFLVGGASTFPTGLPENVCVASLAHDQLVDALCAFDFGFLLRRSDLTNFVAFPNKVGEYLNARLQIIIDSDNLGCVLPEFSPALVNVHEADLTAPPVERAALDLSSIVWRNLGARLLDGYREAGAAMRRGPCWDAGTARWPRSPERHPSRKLRVSPPRRLA